MRSQDLVDNIALHICIWYKPAPDFLPGKGCIDNFHRFYGLRSTSEYKYPMASRKKSELLIHGVAPYKAKKSEEYMGTPQLNHFQQILEGWRHELKDETERTVIHMQDETANHPDPTDRASQETDMALELRGRDRDRKLIKKIEESIIHLKSGDFGFCDNCGEEIGLKRLEARPTARLCIDCKTVDEIREKQLS